MAPLTGGHFFIAISPSQWNGHPANQIGLRVVFSADYATCTVAAHIQPPIGRACLGVKRVSRQMQRFLLAVIASGIVVHRPMLQNV
jgi:hypothetical protein